MTHGDVPYYERQIADAQRFLRRVRTQGELLDTLHDLYSAKASRARLLGKHNAEDRLESIAELIGGIKWELSRTQGTRNED